MKAPDQRMVAATWPAWRGWRVSPRAFRWIAAAAVWALVLTIVSGAAVRLTGSGLGCPDWPDCTASGVVAPLHFHAWVEFGNRLINALVTVAALGAFVAAWRRAPRRRDLTVLAGGLVVGLLAEVGLGALVVQHRLAPGLVMTHFLLGLAFLADAVLLQHRAAIPDEQAVAPRVPLVGRTSRTLARLLLVATAVAVTLGTVVTSTGPHGGDPTARRFGFSLHTVAQLHGTSVEVLLGLTLLTMWVLARSQAPRPVIRGAEVMLIAMVAQAAVGYTQYLNGDPVALVAVHVAGACILVVAVLRFYLGLTAPGPARPPAPTETGSETRGHIEPAGEPAAETRPEPALTPTT
jgi:cytochrome c oxidase assembly protein subunit 15